MSQPSRSKRGCVVAVVGLAAVVALAPVQTIRWSGGFGDTEFRLTFTDAAGRPVPGVTLRVETKTGHVVYLYPVNEFLPDAAPASDADGRMTFHHVGRGVEFGGRDTGCLVGIYYHSDTAPQYVCVFSHGGRDVHRLRYDDLRLRRQPGQSVERVWRDSDWPRREWLANHERWDRRQCELFPTEADGRLYAEVAAAWRYFDRFTELRGEMVERPITFSVVERTITLP